MGSPECPFRIQLCPSLAHRSYFISRFLLLASPSLSLPPSLSFSPTPQMIIASPASSGSRARETNFVVSARENALVGPKWTWTAKAYAGQSPISPCGRPNQAGSSSHSK
ncbi:hypothetical protein BDV26DRAFT_61150 [Aspergillus bertholletiae]|uniref:Uncharacterized protein n=1 Tax=Aspergillus bertholletiae TaxID=1226010 RepID=A0A5N7AV08_9EURO|nr:hypothetical protein BDV26DRAFT_61150 [Aspergillus bertholletiae]